MSRQMPEFYFWRALKASPFKLLAFIVFAVGTSSLYGLVSMSLGHYCLSSDQEYLADFAHHLSGNEIIYIGDVGGLIASPLWSFWLAVLINTYERFCSQNASARAEWLRHAFTGVYRTPSVKLMDAEAREQAYQELYFYSEASWLVFVPLSLFNVFFSIGFGALIGTVGSAAVKLGTQKHAALSGMVGGVLLSLILLFLASIIACICRAQGLALPLLARYAEKEEAAISKTQPKVVKKRQSSPHTGMQADIDEKWHPQSLQCSEPLPLYEPVQAGEKVPADDKKIFSIV